MQQPHSERLPDQTAGTVRDGVRVFAYTVRLCCDWNNHELPVQQFSQQCEDHSVGLKKPPNQSFQRAAFGGR
jgi:hypothetical protein